MQAQFVHGQVEPSLRLPTHLQERISVVYQEQSKGFKLTMIHTAGHTEKWRESVEKVTSSEI